LYYIIIKNNCIHECATVSFGNSFIRTAWKYLNFFETIIRMSLPREYELTFWTLDSSHSYCDYMKIPCV